MNHFQKYYILLCINVLAAATCIAQKTDTLEAVKVISAKQLDIAASAVPVQRLGKKELQQLNSASAADAVKYFSGTIVKDYGGVGGLKTVSVRSLGANHTGVLYNGIALGDAQGGQTDLGKISLNNIDEILLYNAAPANILQTARAYSYGSVLMLQSGTFTNTAIGASDLDVSMKAGSFSLLNPSVNYKYRISKRFRAGISGNYLYSKGDYKFVAYENGEGNKVRRNNAAINAGRLEADAAYAVNDSNILQLKVYYYNSDRGLPGGVIFYNPYSGQHLDETNFFAQANWQNYISAKSRLLISVKYSKDDNFYLDPNYPNADHKLENRFHQQEQYLSAAYSYKPLPGLTLSAATDFFHSTLKRTDKYDPKFATPDRNTFLNNLAVQFKQQRFELSGNALYSVVDEKVIAGKSGRNLQELTPALSASVQPFADLPLRLRVFYKNIFRAPTFNDLYYTNIGNTDLKPEYAQQYNAGITYNTHWTKFLREFSLTADGYINNVKDRILAVPRTDLFQWSMMNVGKVKIHGLDATVHLGFKNIGKVAVSAGGAYAYQQALDRSDAADPKYNTQLPYTPEHSGSMHIGAGYKRMLFAYNAIFSSYRYRLGDQTPENVVQGWSQHDISIQYAFTGTQKIGYSLLAELNNIYNTQYEVIRFYPMPGFNIRLGITATIKNQHNNKQ